MPAICFMCRIMPLVQSRVPHFASARVPGAPSCPEIAYCVALCPRYRVRRSILPQVVSGAPSCPQVISYPVQNRGPHLTFGRVPGILLCPQVDLCSWYRVGRSTLPQVECQVPSRASRLLHVPHHAPETELGAPLCIR